MKTWMADKWNRMIIRIKLVFVYDEKLRTKYLIAYALYSPEGRQSLAEAMVSGEKPS